MEKAERIPGMGYGKSELTVAGEAEACSAGYLEFIGRVKTEREAVRFCEQTLKAAGFRPLESFDRLVPGDRVCKVIKNKGIAAAVVGESRRGFAITVAHADSPLLALKSNPFSEELGLGFGSLYARGGIKPYLWTDIPLAIHGTVAARSGEVLDLVIGEPGGGEGCFMIPDASLHLSGSRMERRLGEAVPLEELKILVSCTQESPAAEGSIVSGVLRHLEDAYGIGSSEIAAAELYLVPRGEALEIGFDRGMIAAYGHDDRICVYAGLKALIAAAGARAVGSGGQTEVFFAVDREEIGSIGNTSARSMLYAQVLYDIWEKQYGESSPDGGSAGIAAAFEASRVLSADVAVLTGPLEREQSDLRHAGMIGHGLCIDRYMSSSNFEFVQPFVAMLEREGIPWQMVMPGKGTVQFGGSVADSFARLGMEVINAGPGILCSHAPREIVSRQDLVTACRAFRAFYTHAGEL